MKISAPGRIAPTHTAIRRRALFLGAAGLVSGLFMACGQDPGTTGLGYLEDQGVRVSAPLYHLVLEDLPLDSVFAAETPLNHYGESLLVVGREGPYLAKARMGFQITTQAQRDSLASGLFLRLFSLPLGNDLGDSACNTSTLCGGRAWLRQEARNRDSLTLLVESYSWPDSTGGYNDSLTAFHRRILTSPQPFSTLSGTFRKRDTIRVSPRWAYSDANMIQDTSQAGELRNLWSRLRNGGGSDTARRWLVFLEISPLRTTDSGMYRFYVQGKSGLWLGRYNDANLKVGNLMTPYPSGFSYVPAANYEVTHNGPSTRSLLHGVARGVHLRINRDTLLARIASALRTTYPNDSARFDRMFSGSAGSIYDRRFFVPYAEMRLPLDAALSKVNGPFALDMSVSSDVDSLDDVTQNFGEVSVATGDSLRLTVHGGGAYGNALTDTLVVRYLAHPEDSAYRQVLLRWANDGSTVDTFTTTPDGKLRELSTRRRTGWARAATLSVRPAPATLAVQVYFNVAGVVEPRGFVDSTGKSRSDYATISRRYWRPGADSLNLRVTRGVRGLLNRVGKPGIAPDMLLRGVERAVYDTSAVSGSRYRTVPYPVMGEIEFKRGGDGKLRVGLDLYLYPLENGQ